jgi:hypothetical protein
MRPKCVASGFLFPVGSGRHPGSHRGRIGDQLADATKRPATVSGQRDAHVTGASSTPDACPVSLDATDPDRTGGSTSTYPPSLPQPNPTTTATLDGCNSPLSAESTGGSRSSHRPSGRCELRFRCAASRLQRGSPAPTSSRSSPAGCGAVTTTATAAAGSNRRGRRNGWTRRPPTSLGRTASRARR